MKIVIYSPVLNNHQANVADELWEQTNHQFCFIELTHMAGIHKKGDTRDYTKCPYLLRSWHSKENRKKAMDLARTAECCIFSGVQALPFQKERLKLKNNGHLLTFDMSERWLKKGYLNLASPVILKMILAYWLLGWKSKPVYKLCCSAFAALDHNRLGMYRNKCYKWGYFTRTDIEPPTHHSSSGMISLMWCGRYLKLKHPELPVLLAKKLKMNGYDFHLDMYGEGEYKNATVEMVRCYGLEDVVSFVGNMPNTQLMADMRKHEVFLFTSDRNEGWGAVANESMANGCVLISSGAIGCTPYLVKDSFNGFAFRAPSTRSSIREPDTASLNELYEKVVWLLEHREECSQMRTNAVNVMRRIWSPKNAASCLINLTQDLKDGRESSIIEGPCSKA